MEAVVSGAYAEARSGAAQEERFRSLLARLDDVSLPVSELDAACSEMQELVAGLELPKGLVAQVCGGGGRAPSTVQVSAAGVVWTPNG